MPRCPQRGYDASKTSITTAINNGAGPSACRTGITCGTKVGDRSTHAAYIGIAWISRVEAVMGLQINEKLFLRHPREQVFQFFALAGNLNLLTPPWLGFSILTPSPVVMAVGTTIEYRIKLHGVPITWESEITELASTPRILRCPTPWPLPLLGPPAYLRRESGRHSGH